MKASKLTYLLLFGLMCIFACDNGGYNSANYNEQSNSHNYSGDSQSNPNKNSDQNNFQDDLGDNTEVRDIWQNYRVVIDKLGDLNDKVVADIGAGPFGYFTLRIANNSEIKKIIAIDIDQDAIRFIENAKIMLDKDVQEKIETRLVGPSDPELKPEEADIVIIVNTYMYFEKPVEYLKNLKQGIAKDGKLVIIDFKKRNTPVGPPVAYRTAIGKLEQDLMEAGYSNIDSDDNTLAYQYIIIAQPGVLN